MDSAYTHRGPVVRAISPALMALALLLFSTIAHSASPAITDHSRKPIPECRPADRDDPSEVCRTSSGIVRPYPLSFIVRAFGICEKGVRKHAAIDVGGVGEVWGLGTPVHAMFDARVVRIGRPDDNPARYGRLDKRSGWETRRGVRMPRAANIASYGRVHYFTTDYGSSKTGYLLIMRVLDHDYRGYTLRYMHLGAIHPNLEVGETVRAGQEVGVMGSSAILYGPPHVHIDMETPQKRRVDVEALLGLCPKHPPCR